MTEDIYREYYLAVQAVLALGEAVGVTDEDWRSAQCRLGEATAGCEAVAAQRTEAGEFLDEHVHHWGHWGAWHDNPYYAARRCAKYFSARCGGMELALIWETGP